MIEAVFRWVPNCGLLVAKTRGARSRRSKDVEPTLAPGNVGYDRVRESRASAFSNSGEVIDLGKWQSSFNRDVQGADQHGVNQAAIRPATESVSVIVHTARAIIRNEGAVRVSDIVHQTGLGLRQFERRFAHEIGVSPKLYARIIRFEAALQWRATSPSLSWTDIAHELGYHDQMHMVHDFTRLSGDSPDAISSHLDMFVRPEVLTARPATKLARMS